MLDLPRKVEYDGLMRITLKSNGGIAARWPSQIILEGSPDQIDYLLTLLTQGQYECNELYVDELYVDAETGEAQHGGLRKLLRAISMPADRVSPKHGDYPPSNPAEDDAARMYSRSDHARAEDSLQEFRKSVAELNSHF